ESNGGGGTTIYGYHAFLTLASGLQMAGPHLTPQSFQQGLFAAHFENPGCDGPPLYQGCVGFGPDDHTMNDSFVEVWSSNHDHPDEFTLAGFDATYCYGELNVPHGVRYRIKRPGELPGNAWITGRDTQYSFGEP